MTGTDEHQNSHSHSGTLTQGNDPVPQPVFAGAAGFSRDLVLPPAQAATSKWRRSFQDEYCHKAMTCYQFR
jgi:hypothetical protein